MQGLHPAHSHYKALRMSSAQAIREAPLFVTLQARGFEGQPHATPDTRAVYSITASSTSDGPLLLGQAGPATLKKRGSSFASSSFFRSASCYISNLVCPGMLIGYHVGSCVTVARTNAR